MTLATDLNYRERRSYVERLRKHGEQVELLAKALEAADDQAAIAPLAIASLLGGPVFTELLNIFKEAAEVADATEALDKDPPPQEIRRDG